MPYSPIVTTGDTWVAGGDNTKVATPVFDDSGANLSIAAVFYTDFFAVLTAAELTSDRGLTWTALNAYRMADTSALRLFYSTGGGSGFGASNKLVVDAANALVAAVILMSFSGAQSTPFDQQNGNQPLAAAVSRNTNSVTPTEDNELLFGAWELGNSATGAAIDSGFTIAMQIDGISGTTFGGIVGYKIQTSAGAEDPTLTTNETVILTAAIATFKGTAPAASGGWGPLLGFQRNRRMVTQ